MVFTVSCISLIINTPNAIAISKRIASTSAGRSQCTWEERYDSLHSIYVYVYITCLLVAKLHNFRRYLQSVESLYCHPKSHTQFHANFVNPCQNAPYHDYLIRGLYPCRPETLLSFARLRVTHSLLSFALCNFMVHNCEKMKASINILCREVDVFGDWDF